MAEGPWTIAISHQPSAMTTLSEGNALRLGARRGDDEREDEDERDEPAHRLRIREALAERRLDVRDARGEHHAELVREAGEEPAQVVRRELVDVRRNHAPRALHEELHQEDADQNPPRAVARDPERYDDEAADHRRQHGAA